MKTIATIFSVIMLLATAGFTVYSFTFPFKAGHPLQGVWFALIFIGSSLGILISLLRRHGTFRRWALISAVGPAFLLLFMVLYITLGYVLLGV
ncbi:hypothetical protein GE107_22655 [Cohnella sp. CFH 77786]|uniref:hypothetical protein n=1 Tax=Cohnella sp. CFH 77786 TaxID=2662265 RepID=UPI001C609A53|nr:hypothetical protein [Cohnella sp. CFH 77786]MBW5448846.1 hypothetical protein [Cohnella sp. CFH 77786]